MKDVSNNFDFTFIRQLRKSKGFNFDVLSHKSGISKPTLHSIESGRNIPTLPTINAIANALDVSTLDILHLAHVPDVKIADVTPFERISNGSECNAVCACNNDLHCLCVKAAPGEIIDGKAVSCSLEMPYRVTCVVVEGELKVKVGIREYFASKGQYLCFPAIGHHSYSSVNGVSRFVLVHSVQNVMMDLEAVIKKLTC